MPDSLFGENSPLDGGNLNNSASMQAENTDDRLEKLTLICWAMWTLIQEVTDLTEQDLLKRVNDLDLLDGSPDGTATQQIVKCPKCSRVMSPKHGKCLYCGTKRVLSSAFDLLV